MKKDIYKITNLINGKIYIGQSVDPQKRWYNHCHNAKKGYRNSAIDKAINKYGEENFKLEIIEKAIENYDELEKYYITFYDCMIPKGYNILEGGQSFPLLGSPVSLIKDENILNNIIQELRDNTMPQVKIAKKYGVSKGIISSINRGTAYRRDGIDYPIRSRKSDFLTDIDYENIFNDITNTKLLLKEIAEKYGVTDHCVSEINCGIRYHKENCNYPLRNKEENPLYDNIKKELETSTLSLRKIAKKFNTSYSMVQTINSGRYHHDDWREYPIRKSS